MNEEMRIEGCLGNGAVGPTPDGFITVSKGEDARCIMDTFDCVTLSEALSVFDYPGTIFELADGHYQESAIRLHHNNQVIRASSLYDSPLAILDCMGVAPCFITDPLALGASGYRFFIQDIIIKNGSKPLNDTKYKYSIMSTSSYSLIDFRAVEFEEGNEVAILLTGENAYFINCFFQKFEGQIGGAISQPTNPLQQTLVLRSYFRNNTALTGGAIAAEVGRIIIVGSLFKHNEAKSALLDTVNDGLGGALFIGPVSSVLVSESKFVSNFASQQGGSIVFKNVAGIMTDSVVETSSSEVSGGGISLIFSGMLIFNTTVFGCSSAFGGAIYLSGQRQAEINRMSIYDNQASDYGGGVCALVSYLAIFDSSFRKNVADLGGGLLSQTQSIIRVQGSSFDLNEASSGAGIYLHDVTNAHIEHVDFRSNTADSQGGGLYIHTYESINLKNMTFDLNSAASGGGIYYFKLANASQIHLSDTHFGFNGVRETSSNGYLINHNSSTPNSALYGPNIATNAEHLIVAKGFSPAFEATSGEFFTETVTIELRDAYEQLVLTDSSSIVSIKTRTASQTFVGETESTVKMGQMM